MSKFSRLLVINVEVDHVSGKVALIGTNKRNYSMQVELRFLGHHLSQEHAGWFGVVMRAQDLENYELVWFMPNAESGKTVAYVPVAHGVVPWWTEAYATQEKGTIPIPANNWFQVRIEVTDDNMSLFVEDNLIFSKKLTYYLSDGRPGLYVGTATDAAFKRILIEEL
ncbi:MAG: hypothetical protein ACE5OZ_21205 [Candidatus Heimdallarchaeota archaeon]